MKTKLGIALAAAVAAVLLTASCSSSGDATGSTSKGNVAVTLKATGRVVGAAAGGAGDGSDDGSEGPTAATIVISAASARTTDGTLVPFAGTFPQTVDLLALASSGGSVTLPPDTLPEGSYDAIELWITQASITLHDGTIITITPPGSGWQVLIPVTFDVVPGQTTTITLNLSCDHSFEFVDGEFEFHPELEVEGVENEDDDD